MKYWRGYLVAAIVAACTWALKEFARTHAALVDMFYPYVTRMMQSFLAEWSGGVSYCLWQVLLVALIAVVLTTAVLMLIFKWNPIQWAGWVLAAASVVSLLTTGMYGLNRYSGPLSQDIRLQDSGYTVRELVAAAEFYLEEANTLAEKIQRDPQGNPAIGEFTVLNEQAGEGFRYLTEKKFQSVFAGSTEPVKKLGWPSYYKSKKIGGRLVALTGEAAVNPLAPNVYLPYGICEQMARRMCIAQDRDAHFAAILSCRYNSHIAFRYSGAMMSYYYCEQALESLKKSTGDASLDQVRAGMNEHLRKDMDAYRAFFGTGVQDTRTADLLVSWHIQERVLPLEQEEEVKFDPLDETQVDLSGLVNAPTVPAGE